MICERCYTPGVNRDRCESLTCRLHTQYWNWRESQKNRMPPMPEWLHDRIETCRLHIAFLFLEETDEMMGLLRKNKTERVNNDPSYSHISECPYQLSPINWTAARVAAWIGSLRLPKV